MSDCAEANLRSRQHHQLSGNSSEPDTSHAASKSQPSTKKNIERDTHTAEGNELPTIFGHAYTTLAELNALKPDMFEPIQNDGIWMSKEMDTLAGDGKADTEAANKLADKHA
jgi:hypothetical protein